MEDKKFRMYQLASRFITIFSVFSFLICFIFAPQLSNIIIGELEGGTTLKDVTFVIRLISFALLVIPMLSIKRGYLQGHTFIKEPSVSQIIEQVVRISIIIIGSYLCVYIFDLPIRYAVGISVFAACIGGIATYLYLSFVINRNKKQIGLDITVKSTKDVDREIIRKIITYSIPFIVINLANTIYTFIDMVLVIRTLPKLAFSAADTEFISSVFTTWGVKFSTIVTSVSTGLIISLIPNIVRDYTENKIDLVNQNFNKCLKIILLIIAPIAIFISCMSNSMWNIFYGANRYGPVIIRYTIIVTIFDCLYMVINSLLQSVNRRKTIYVSVLVGLLLNLALDIPLMHLFSQLGVPAYYGAITATLIGFFASNLISLIYLNKDMKINYRDTVAVVPRFVISIIVLIFVLTVFKNILPIDSHSRLIQLFNILVSGCISLGVYFIINVKSIMTILPNKIVKKLKLFVGNVEEK